MTSSIASREVVTAREGLHTEWFDDGEFAAAVIDVESGTRHHLDGAASAIWALCEAPITPDELIGEVVELGADPTQAEEIVATTLDLFSGSGLLAGTKADAEEVGQTHDSADEMLPLAAEP